MRGRLRPGYIIGYGLTAGGSFGGGELCGHHRILLGLLAAVVAIAAGMAIVIRTPRRARAR